MTPHNEALKNDIAKIVLMPGDPMRAKMIAETYLNDYKLVNDVRGMYAYTGYYKNKLITVMGSGMGIPSIGIYSYELYKYYDVDNIIRIGTIGAIQENLKLYDLVLATSSYSLSSYAYQLNGYDKHDIKSDENLNHMIETTARQLNKKIVSGCVYSSDAFYAKSNYDFLSNTKECLGIDMECFALFYNAKLLNKKASAILTVSNNLITREETDSDDRQNHMNDMIELALETAINL